MKRASLVALTIALAAGVPACANVLGLGDYADGTDGGDDAALDAGAHDDGASADGDATFEASSDAAADASVGDAGDSGNADAAPDSAIADSGVDSGAADASVDAADAGADAAVDSPSDAPLDHDAACETSVEDCTNGVDDNCDGKVDCADPQCGGYSCVAAPPAGWQGPLALYDGIGNPLPAPPSCPSSYADDLFDGYASLNAPPASCGCTCGSATGQTCVATASFYTDNSCGASCGTASLTNGVCANVSPTLAGCGNAHMTVSAPAPTGGACAAQATSNVAQYTWGQEGRACSHLGTFGDGGCSAAAQQCAPTPVAPYGAKLCILAAGSVACPSGSYNVQHIFYQNVSDSRACSSCSCGSPAGGTCTGNAQVQPTSDTACSQSIFFGQFGAPATCRTPANGERGLLMNGSTPGGAGCAALGGAPVGQATPTNATTVCCMP